MKAKVIGRFTELSVAIKPLTELVITHLIPEISIGSLESTLRLFRDDEASDEVSLITLIPEQALAVPAEIRETIRSYCIALQNLRSYLGETAFIQYLDDEGGEFIFVVCSERKRLDNGKLNDLLQVLEYIDGESTVRIEQPAERSGRAKKVALQVGMPIG